MGISPLKRAVFLDRDGVLNKAIVRDGKPYPPPDESELEVVNGASETLGRLTHVGFDLVVVSNQPDVARGTQTREEVERLDAVIRQRLPMLNAFYICYHDDADNCPCRKPKPGMLLDAAADRGVDLRHSYMIGDRWRDIGAGQAAGVQSIFIDYGYRERQPVPPFRRVASLREAVSWILAQSR
jgi:D-glycero-D-manno-heptose 1,7-bisphosphate phosphatase